MTTRFISLVTATALIALTAVTASAQTVRACDLLDLAEAASVIGSGASLPGGDTERDSCLYVNPGVAMLTIQIGTAELYDQIQIPEPHTPTSIGTRGRHTVQPSGMTAVQFEKGSYSVTIGVRPIGNGSSGHLPALLAAAQKAVTRLP